MSNQFVQRMRSCTLSFETSNHVVDELAFAVQLSLPPRTTQICIEFVLPTFTLTWYRTNVDVSKFQ